MTTMIKLASYWGFNPLHCGAVVASWVILWRGLLATRFQSPSLRGSGRFAFAVWRAHAEATGFNPLHCGAVVASCPPASPHGGGRCFNPLHCGAVVASGAPRGRAPRRAPVSIPFIAGQWSLRAGAAGSAGAPRGFNPLHCGAVVASRHGPREADRDRVSIPFIAGQWSLLPRTTPSSLFGVLLRKRRLPCDHIICTRLPF